MSYCDRSNITAVLSEEDLIQLTDTKGTGAADEAKISKAIVSAGHVIDGYLRGPYTLPLETNPPILADVAADLAIYRLHRGRDLPDDVTDSYKNAIATLRAIQKKELLLFDVVDTDDETPPSDEIVIVSRDREFTDDVLSKM